MIALLRKRAHGSSEFQTPCVMLAKTLTDSKRSSCRRTFELSGRRRQDAKPRPVRMYRVQPDRAGWPAVGAPLERGVRGVQAFDFAAEVAGVQTTCCPAHPANTTASTAVYLLWLAHGDRAAKDIAIHCRAADARAASQSEHIGLPRHQRTSAFVGAADALGTRTVKCAVPEPKK